MDQTMIYELIGYLASALVAVSLLMTSILRLRVINIIGACVFVAYGLLIGAFPVALVNGIIVLINLYQLRRLFNMQDEFKLLDVSVDSPYLHQFIAFHRQEIERFYPAFTARPINAAEADIVIFILRNMLPVGLFIARTTEGAALVKLDYVIPDYRDFKVGSYLYNEKRGCFQQKGIERLISYPGNAAHQRYLERMGFVRDFTTSDRKLYQLRF